MVAGGGPVRVNVSLNDHRPAFPSILAGANGIMTNMQPGDRKTTQQKNGSKRQLIPHTLDQI